MKSKRFIYLLLPVILFVCITFISYPFLFTQFSQKTPLGDSPDVFYILSVINHSLLAPVSEIYHLPFYYPKPYVLTFGHPLFGVTVFFNIFKFAGLTLTQSNNLYIIFCLVCGAFGCYLLAREISGHALFSFVFASFYILFAENRIEFGIINFLSHFLVPYIFYFFVKFFKGKKKYNAIIASFLSFSIFFTEIYYGVHLWAIILPAFLLLAAILKVCSWKELRFILLNLFMASLLLLAVYSPFLTQIGKEHLSRDFGAETLMYPQQLFYGNTLMALLLGKPHGGTHLFPGMLFSTAVLMFFASGLRSLKKTSAGILFLCLMLASYFYYANPFLLDLSFFLLLVILAALALVGRKKMNAMEKLLLLTFAVFFLLMLNFPNLPVLRSLTIYKFVFNSLPGMNGLRGIGRVVMPLALPFLICMAALGFRNVFTFSRPKNILAKITPWILALVAVAAMGLENVSAHYPMHSLPGKETVYEKIPFNKNKIILEYPWDYGFNKYYLNGLYMFNWLYHRNFILNGRSAFFPVSYIDSLGEILEAEPGRFPNDQRLKQLTEDFGVTHVIFHWELIRRFFPKPRKTIAELKANIQKIAIHGKTVYQDRNHCILLVGDFIPASRFVRTYSYDHLRYHMILFTLSEPYEGKVIIGLNGKTVQAYFVDSTFIRVDLKKEDLKGDQNMVEWQFAKPVPLKDIEIQ